MEGALNIRVITDLEQFKTIYGAWSKLEKQISCHYYHRYLYYKSYYQHLMPEKHGLYIILIYIDDRLVAIFPWEIRKKSFLGIKYQEVGSPQHDHIDLCDILINHNYLLVLSNNFHLIVNKFPKNTMIVTKGHKVQSYAYRLFNEIKSHNLITTIAGGNYCINTDGINLDEYIPGKEKRDLRRLSNKLKKQDEYEFRYLKGEHVKWNDFNLFMQIESSGWKGKSRTAILFDEKLINFYASFISSNLIQINLLLVNKKCIAAQYCFFDNEELSFLKIALDENYKTLAPTIMLCFQSFKEKLENNPHSTMNFVTAPEWGRKWKATYSKLYTYTLTSRKINILLKIIIKTKGLFKKYRIFSNDFNA